MSDRPWYIQIDRLNMDLSNLSPIVIGPFDTEAEAASHGQDSTDVEDWCYGEAKAKQYIVDDVFWTQDPEIPEYGINAPIPDIEEQS